MYSIMTKVVMDGMNAMVDSMQRTYCIKPSCSLDYQVTFTVSTYTQAKLKVRLWVTTPRLLGVWFSLVSLPVIHVSGSNIYQMKAEYHSY